MNRTTQAIRDQLTFLPNR